jgi:succinoglycan biosynthesis protein ExoO
MVRWVVIVTDRQVTPPTRGARVRILGLVRGLRALGWSVALIGPPQERPDLVLPEVDDFRVVDAPGFPGGEIGRFDWKPFRSAVARTAAMLRPAAVIAEYAWLAPTLMAAPATALRLVDCHDVLHERTRRFREAGLDPWVDCAPAQERGLLSHADVLIACQYRDAHVLRQLTHKRVHCLLPYVDTHGLAQSHSVVPGRVLAVGAMHSGNDGILRFADSVWPMVRATDSGACLQIAGSIGSGERSVPGIEWLGEVDDLHLSYRSASVVVCPVNVGTGVKIKLLEAIRYGKAVVATSAAQEGLPLGRAPAWITADGPANLGAAICGLLVDDERRSALEREAARYDAEYLSEMRFLRVLKAIMPNVISSRVRVLLQ